MSLINRPSLIFLYSSLILLSILYLVKNRKSLYSLLTETIRSEVPLFQKLLLVTTGLILILALLTALISAPNNWDSMVYHLARIPYWIQQGHVGHFPAHVTRQLGFPPLSEFIMMHSLLINDSDRFLNIFQWLFSFGSILSVSLIAKHLIFSKEVQIISILIAASSPMLIMQSSSTQNDIVNSFFLLSTLVFILRFRNSAENRDLFFIALSAGLGLLTKGTAYIYLFPMAIWTLVLLFQSSRKSWKVVLLGVIAILIVNTGHWWRNHSVFGNPLGPDTHTMTYYHSKAVASNLIRNTVMELSTGIKPFDTFLGKASYKLHSLLGIDQNDPRTTWAGSMPFEMRPLRLQEDYANNPIHLLLFFFSLIYLLIFRKRLNNRIVYLLTIIIAFILFSALLEWQVWHNRLHLPFILMTVPFSAHLLSRFKIPGYSILVFMSLFALYASFNNESRMLYGENAIWKKTRMEQYFTTRPDMLQDWERINEKLIHIKEGSIGIIGSAAIWDYPTWSILNSDKRFTIHNVLAENPSNYLSDQYFQPDFILLNKHKAVEKDSFNHISKLYKKIGQSGELTLYEMQ